MSNFGLRSKWFNSDSLEELLEILMEGDLLEFDRALYCHWAVCISAKDKGVVVHRVSGITEGSLAFMSQSHSLRKTAHKIGEIAEDDIADVLEGKKVRINNSIDKPDKLRQAADIVKLAKYAIGSDQFGEYNVMTNNCEHFAKMCRYGEKRSDQVIDAAIGGAVVVGALALGGLITWAFSKNTKTKSKSYNGWEKE